MEIPPPKHDPEAELAVLGSLLHAGRDRVDDCVDMLFDVLSPDDFFAPLNKAVFAAAKELRGSREPIDVLLISRKLSRDGVPRLLAAAVGAVTGTALAEHYAKLVLEASRQRKALQVSLDALHAAKSMGGAEAAIDLLKSGLESIENTERAKPLVTASQATDSYLRCISSGNKTLMRTALPQLDSALGGGVDFGEMVILAARPSHGKTAIALQCAHNWTEDEIPVLYVSLEMSAIALGKRIMQYSSDVPEEYWRSDMQDLRCDVERYHDGRSELFIAESLVTLDNIVREIERSVRKRGVRAVVVDYAQLIQSPGKSRYEQITHTSTVLRGLASEHQIVMLVICQMSREIEARRKFVPIMSDIKESGQFEQDADVVVFLVWPHRIDSNQPAHEYQFYIAKNRNRPITTSAFTARFEPSRQRVVPPTVRDQSNYEPSFAEYDPWDQVQQ